MRSLLRLGSSALLLVAIMVLGSLVMWVGIPLAWLWIASQLEASTNSLGAAVVVALVGVILSIILIVALLNWLSDRHRRLRIARGHADSGPVVLEAVLVTSAVVVVVGFGVWFLLFAGSSPIPIGINP